MSDITYGMVQLAMGEMGSFHTPEGRAEFWRMWVTLERELADERYRQARLAPGLRVEHAPGPRSPTDASAPNLGAVLGALAGVMAASQAPRSKDEDDGA